VAVTVKLTTAQLLHVIAVTLGGYCICRQFVQLVPGNTVTVKESKFVPRQVLPMAYVTVVTVPTLKMLPDGCEYPISQLLQHWLFVNIKLL
jgi:hypothetical protein